VAKNQNRNRRLSFEGSLNILNIDKRLIYKMVDFYHETWVSEYCSTNAFTDDDKPNNAVALCQVFLILLVALPFFMEAGFAILYVGSLRRENTTNILSTCIMGVCASAIGFWAIGYNVFSDDNSLSGSGNDWISVFFQFSFAAFGATIVAGTIAERSSLVDVYVVLYVFWSFYHAGTIYPHVVYLIWSPDSWLSAFSDDPYRGVGMIDLAGSGVVHMAGGATALVAAIVVGPRKGRFYDEDGKPLETPADFPPHRVALQVLGTFLLWFGWYGFNVGSALFNDTVEIAATCSLCAVTTTIAAASGCISSMFIGTIIEKMSTGEAPYDLTKAMHGTLAGLVAISAGCSIVTPWASIIIGMIGGWVYLLFSKYLIKWKIDDAVDAIPVHFANGMWGVFAVGLFAEPDLMAIAGYNSDVPGIFYGGDGSLLLCQFAGVVCICAWMLLELLVHFMLLLYPLYLVVSVFLREDDEDPVLELQEDL
jgi:Amt family ammonium transporter